MDYLTQRFDYVAEGIYENEALTADLHDQAAQALLDWGVACAKMVVDGTAGIEDDEEADKAMYARLRANRSLMRSVNKWVAKRQGMSEEASQKELEKIRRYATTVYGEQFTPPNDEQSQAFISSYQAHNDAQMVLALRSLFEDEQAAGSANDEAPSKPCADQNQSPANEASADEAQSKPSADQNQSPASEVSADEAQSKPSDDQSPASEAEEAQPERSDDQSPANETSAGKAQSQLAGKAQSKPSADESPASETSAGKAQSKPSTHQPPATESGLGRSPKAHVGNLFHRWRLSAKTWITSWIARTA